MMSTIITVQSAEPMAQFEFEDCELPRKIAKTEALDLYNRGLQQFNSKHSTALEMSMFLLSPAPDQLETQSVTWGTAAARIPRWTMTLLPEGKEAVQSSLQSTINSAITTALEQHSAAMNEDIENKVAPLQNRISSLENDVAVLKTQMSLAAPILVRKVIYKGRQVLIDRISPGSSCKVENFTAWLSQQDNSAILKEVSSDQLDCLSKWGTIDGDTVAHCEIVNEEPILAAAVESLDDGLSKNILRSLFRFSFGAESADVAKQPTIPVNITKPGKALMGKPRMAGKSRNPAFPTISPGPIRTPALSPPKSAWTTSQNSPKK